MGAVKRLEGPARALLRTIGRLLISPRPPRATGGYGLASRGALVTLFVIGVAVAWMAHPTVGVGIMLVAALALLQFLVLQYEGALLRPVTAAWLLAVVAVLGVVIGVFWSGWSGRDGAAGDVLVLTVVVAGAVVSAVVRWGFRLIFGPHHPVSAQPDPYAPPPLWFWVGRVRDTGATAIVRTATGVGADSIAVEFTPTDDDDAPGRSVTARPDADRFARFELTDLDPDRRYELRVEARSNGEVIGVVNGSFTTFPPAGEGASLTMVFGSCMSTGSKGWVFDTIAGLEPRIFVVTGDLHYENLTSRRTERFLDVYDRVHASAPLGRLFRSTPVAYVWDDHDFGDNDSDHSSPSKDAAQAAYRSAVPSYVDPDSAGAIHQEFTIGRVRVLITDNRSERGATPGHLIEPAAEAWLIDRITDPTWPVVLWVSPTPWIGDDADSDNWAAYGEQRHRIATAIGDRSTNLVMVSGDAHMVAIDDGDHSGYAGDGSGFPVLHAAALDRLGSVKGGPFSHGRYPGAGQFGVVTVDDRSHEIGIELSGRSWTGAEIISHSFTIPVDTTQGTNS
jgi:hypothetical protein